MLNALMPDPELDGVCRIVRKADKETIYVNTPMVSKEYMNSWIRLVRSGHHNFTITDNPPKDGSGWALTWGEKRRETRNALAETGFWRTALHIDTHGLYANSSFNQPENMREVLRFSAPRSAADIVLSGDFPASKYRQPNEKRSWDGVILPLQVPRDRSVKVIGDQNDFWTFVRKACEKYGRNLLLKVHPYNQTYDIGNARAIANEYDVTIGNFDIDDWSRCEFVLTYCSTYCVDAFLHGVPVVQTAPGYFYKTGAVTYTAGELPDGYEDTTETAYRLADFLIWRYCFVYEQPAAAWIQMLNHFAASTATFPMTDEWCYATNLQHVIKETKAFFDCNCPQTL